MFAPVCEAWAYRFSVIIMLECPIIYCRFFGFMFFCANRVQNVCLNICEMCIRDRLKNRRNIRPVYRKVPIIIGGEKSVSLDEPMVSINRLCDEAEKDERIMSASFHIGYLRHDGDKLGCSVVVVPQSGKDVYKRQGYELLCIDGIYTASGEYFDSIAITLL